MNEYRQIEDFPNYSIGLNGTVLNNRTGRIKTASKNKHGYNSICLRKNGKTYVARLCRIVAKAFVPNPDNKKEVNHKNGIRNDDRPENLEWVTTSENAKHSFDHLGRRKWNLGKPHPCKFKPVVCYSIGGNIVGKFESIKEASLKTKVNYSGVWLSCAGKIKSIKGLVFNYNKELV